MTFRIRPVALIAACVSLLAGCSGEPQERPEAVATIRPLAAIVEPVIGSEIHVLLSPGASPHTYDPRPSDVRLAAGASVLFFGSKDLDAWAAGFDAEAKVAMLGLVPDSMLHVDRRNHVDPHFWMDPLTVRSVLPALADTMCALESSRCEAYRRGAASFAERLSAVHDSVSVLMAAVAGKPVMLAHPFLDYFARRYGLYVAGIVEEIPGSEPTPSDMMRMIELANHASAEVIFTLPQHSSRAAEAIAEAANLKLVELDPIGGGSNGYADLLYFNASTIRNALVQNASQKR